MAILGKNSHFLTQILIFFGRLCPQAFLVIPICRNIFLKAHFFKKNIKKGRMSIQFYSLAKELCSLEYWLLEKAFGNCRRLLDIRAWASLTSSFATFRIVSNSNWKQVEPAGSISTHLSPLGIQRLFSHKFVLWLAVYHNDLCWCFSVAASGMWEFPPQGLNSRLKSWGSCTHPQSYSKG